MKRIVEVGARLVEEPLPAPIRERRTLLPIDRALRAGHFPEPPADLAAAAALVSSLTNAPLPADAVYFGEVSLSGAVRPVPQTAARLKEAQKLGFARAIVPEAARSEGESALALEIAGSLANLVADIAARGSRSIRPERRAANDE